MEKTNNSYYDLMATAQEPQVKPQIKFGVLKINNTPVDITDEEIKAQKIIDELPTNLKKVASRFVKYSGSASFALEEVLAQKEIEELPDNLKCLAYNHLNYGHFPTYALMQIRHRIQKLMEITKNN